MASPAFVAKSSQANSNGSSLNVAYMGGIVPGDLLIIIANSYQLPGGSVGDIVAPAGWGLLDGFIGYQNSSFQNVGTFKAFYRIADGSESGNAVLTRTGSTGGSTKFHGQMYQFRGTAVNLSDANANGLGAGDSTITWDAVGIIGNEATLVAFACQISAATIQPGGYTNDGLETSAGGTPTYLQCSHKYNATTGPSVTALSGDPAGWCTIHVSMFNANGRRFQILR